jgi:hypothetical protein
MENLHVKYFYLDHNILLISLMVQNEDFLHYFDEIFVEKNLINNYSHYLILFFNIPMSQNNFYNILIRIFLNMNLYNDEIFYAAVRYNGCYISNDILSYYVKVYKIFEDNEIHYDELNDYD